MVALKNFLVRSLGTVASLAIPPWIGSLDIQVACPKPIANPSLLGDGKRRIFLFWHEYLLLPIHLWKHCQIAMLISSHGDADVLEQTAHTFGFETVRGSTKRRSVAALTGMTAKASQYHLTITPDGPQGPRRKMAQGSIYLASRLQMPVMLIGIGYDRPWRLNSWDRFALPRPGSRARIITSDDIIVPPDADRETLEHFRIKTESYLNHLCDEAEDWTTSGDDYAGQGNLQPGPKTSVMFFARQQKAQ